MAVAIMTLWTVTEYVWHRWPRMTKDMFHLSLPQPRFSTFMTYHRIGNTWVHPRFSGVRIVPRFTAILFHIYKGPSWSWTYGRWIYNYLCTQCLSPLKLWVRILDTTLCDKFCQWLPTGRWFSLGPPVFYTNKTDRPTI